MEKRDSYIVLSEELEAMQVSRKITSSAIPTIGAVVEECKNREKFWVSNTEVTPQVTFVLYHASRNTRIIFQKMHTKFVRASELHLNPEVVDQATTVFPELLEMCNLLDSLKEGKTTPEMIGFIRKRVRSLRTTAQKVSMLPTIQEEVEEVDKDEMEQELKELADHLKANLV